MKTKLLIYLIALLLTACGGAEHEAKKAVLKELKDPDSAKFGSFVRASALGMGN